jgi:hypothetical protein
MIDKTNIFAKGELRLFVKETGQEILKKNLVIKNSSHITALMFGGDVLSTTVKVSSWGDNFFEEPSSSYFNMTTLESEENIHAIDGNHTTKTFSVTGHSYPASRSVKFSFQFDRNSADSFIGKNLLEWGLHFNDILFSRVALKEDFFFSSWMTIAGEWTLIFANCAGGYSNYILNQYEISSLWTMDDLTVDQNMPDVVGRNNLQGLITPPKLISNLITIDPNVTSSDYVHKDSLCSFYEDGSVPNALKILDTDIYQNTLDLSTQFTLWQWFKFKDIDQDPFILAPGEKWVLLSKWADDSAGDQAYRLYLERGLVGQDVRLKFDIDNEGTITTISSDALDVSNLNTVNLLNKWCLAAVTLDPEDKKLTLYLNDIEVASTNLFGFTGVQQTNSNFMIGAEQEFIGDTNSYKSSFRGFIDETGISPDLFNKMSLTLLWNQGYGDFFNP